MKNGFFFYENFKTTADSLPDEMRLKFYDALTNYAINGVEPEDEILKALITAFKPSINKIEKRGGNNNPTGQNQYSKVKSGQKEVKVGQSGQSFNKQETGNIKQENNIIISSDKSSDMIVKINDILTRYGLAKIRDLTAERKIKLKERCRSVGGFGNFLGQMEVALAESSFLRGDNDKGWQADFDFFLQKASWQKILEGKYKDKTKWKTIDEKPNSFDIFDEAMEEIERRTNQ